MMDRRNVLGALFGGSAMAALAQIGLSRAAQPIEMQGGTQGTPAPSPRSPGLGDGGMTPSGATQPGMTGSNAGSTIAPRRRRRASHRSRRRARSAT